MPKSLFYKRLYLFQFKELVTTIREIIVKSCIFLETEEISGPDAAQNLKPYRFKKQPHH